MTNTELLPVQNMEDQGSLAALEYYLKCGFKAQYVDFTTQLKSITVKDYSPHRSKVAYEAPQHSSYDHC